MPSPHRPRSSLARSTLLKMGGRIGVLIALTTFVSYVHIFRAFLAETLTQLERSVPKRAEQEQAIFAQAVDNHVVLKSALEERIRAWQKLDPRPRFEELLEPREDGTLHHRTEGFDATSMPQVFVTTGVKVDDGFRRRLLAAYDVVARFGPAFHVRYPDTYVMLPEGALIIYWPEQPKWCQEMTPDYQITDFDIFNISTPERNPQRKSAWATLWVEPISLSLATPVDVDGHHAATLGHDILIEDLKARTVNDRLPGASNILFRDDGLLIAHPELRMKLGVAETYNIVNDPRPPEEIFEQPSTPEQRVHLRAIFERVKSRAPGQNVLELPEYHEYLAVARLKGPEWNFVTVLPESMVSSAAFRAARYVLVFGVASLLVELSIMYWVLRQQITQPLQAFTRGTSQVAAGDFQVSFESQRQDELGQLAQGFELMAHELQRREEALRQTNEGLEDCIQARTQELREKNLELEGTLARLKEAQELLVQKEKLASLGALVSGVAHELKNPLNFVNNFAQVSAELVEELREELKGQGAGQDGSSLERVGTLLDWLAQNVQKIDEHGRRADMIVRSMQLHSRAGERTPTALNALLEESLAQASEKMRSSYPGLEVALRRNLDPSVGKVALVPQDFGQAILNILDNSLYAVAEKKKSVGEAFSSEVNVSSRSTGNRVEIRIRDNGTGIPRELQDKIFNPFFTTKPTGSGTGLGLSISYDIVVRQHGGEIRIESEEGHFTECLIVLPLLGVSA
ncbi:MAG: sensor histidine kinase [Hyalangium sp.]|uniref:sensor histidine kinase n=1 Tax=Hyalangium sp. TaxID=2028555 RepID=UPI00389A033E